MTYYKIVPRNVERSPTPPPSSKLGRVGYVLQKLNSNMGLFSNKVTHSNNNIIGGNGKARGKIIPL